MGGASFGAVLAHLLRRRESRLGVLVRHQLQAAEQPPAAAVSHQGVVRQKRQALLKGGAHLGGMGEDVPLLHQFQVAQRHRRTDRMAGVGEAVPEEAFLGAGFDERLVHEFGNQYRGDGLVGGTQRLGDAHGGGPDAHGFGAEGVAGAPEAADHLVVNEENAVPGQNLLHLFVVAGRRHDDSAGPQHGFGDEGGDGLRAFAQDQVLQVGDDAVAELGLGFAGLPIPIIVRPVRVQHLLDGQVEALVERRQAG